MLSTSKRLANPLITKQASCAFATATATASSKKSQAGQKSRGGYWQPFTDHDKLNRDPKVFARADGMYYYTEDNREVLDATAGLWCVNAGHNQKKIVEAVQKQVATLDYAPCFNLSHKGPSKFAEKLLELVPNRNFSEVFFTMCGSTAVDTSLKIALAYWRAKGEAQRVRLIGRERGYHGVGFGGISVGGISPNRKAFSSQLLPFVDHIAHTHSLKDMAFSKGCPEWGLHLAEDLERVCALHDPSTIAAVIVEPVAGSTGVVVPPAGYLKRIREICDKHGILLIFDEVITGFGRLGTSFGVEKFDVTPDMITCAKGLTNAVIPAGAVICQQHVFDSIHKAAHGSSPEVNIELFHGYTYSGHPLAMAAGIATMEVFKEQQLFERANDLAPYFEQSLHSLKGLPNVVDIRNLGMMGAVELAPVAGAPLKRVMDIFDRTFAKGTLIRASGQTLAFSPPLIAEKKHVDQLVDHLHQAIKESAAAF